jgi:peptidoglycan/xylan/chitin deacetylase (PgdA/CDA1 family)
MLTWDDVKLMHRHGISFGSHSVTHPILSRLTFGKARSEIQDSKRAIEEKLSSPVKTFAYPGGKKEDFNEATKAALIEAGYVCALTAIFGTNGVDQDRMELRRGTPWEEYLPTFATKLYWYRFCS